MLLQTLEVTNFRSLEYVKLAGLGQVNVLIGRNNAGKSAILGALAYLKATAFNLPFVTPVPHDAAALTDFDETRQLGIDLTFAPSQEDRVRFVDLAIASGHVEERRDELINSALLRKVRYAFRAPAGQPFSLSMTGCALMAEDGEWAQIYGLEGRQSVAISRLTHQDRQHRLDADFLSNRVGYNKGFSNQFVAFEIRGDSTFTPRQYEDHVNTWAYGRVARYFANMEFLNPFRHSKQRDFAAAVERLSPSGENLAVVLNYRSGADRPTFDQIEQFLHAALPDAGVLHAGLIRGNDAQNSQQVEISFQTPNGYSVRLSEMGSGVEQLLMTAVLLATTDDQTTLVLEEPETQLHPGAQRHLLERLSAGQRQVFLSTHSPTFVNAASPTCLFQVSRVEGRTKATRLGSATSLAAMLEDIGARKSDLLLSDGVLFVEGPTDRDVILAWSETLEINLAEQNVTVLPMGGGDGVGRHMRARSDVLIGMSQAAPVPHLFVVDRDERGAAEIGSLVGQLGKLIHVLERREIENYLLSPRAIRLALLDKYRDNLVVREAVEQADAEAVGSTITTAEEGLFGTVLMKRVRAEVGGPKGGLLPTDILAELEPDVMSERLPIKVEEAIKSRLEAHVASQCVPDLVVAQRNALQAEWKNADVRRRIAPGEELLSAAFAAFGGEFDKRTDAPRIARFMSREEIDLEIADLIKCASLLPK